ncbi:MAG TPA: PilZ domain-containing protein [Phycisphaerae bacterium]|nr:PilZ domain-containing protein [Phycisphaerae bacterium]HOJ76044.1 PilZ domain-containing protein [Phycisphaerae bacterium]HOM53085.1 PilZ domain-containing protein [Phycisphaerae bacterium]HON67346.1 PilZ domain-containing protein [Phycisphaerae bacterium]HOQ86088.1 PilZ domain-containing protein [Phycisphaerae bacterium]
MASQTHVSDMQMLSHIMEAFGPITAGDSDTWSGKRAHPRQDLILPVRLRLVTGAENVREPAFTARSRDISCRGLGLTVPCKLEPHKHFDVEVFTDRGTWVGRMRLVHCTQTIGGYKVGLECAAADGDEAEAAERDRCRSDESSSEILTLEQACEEVRHWLRRYQLAEVTWGLFGMTVHREVQRILRGFPPPPPSRIKLEPRRRNYRHEVEGSVHLLVSRPKGPELVTTRIVDLSAGGARVMLSKEPGAQPSDASGWVSGLWMAVGIWTPDQGTVWLPARAVHGGSPLFTEKSIGLEFVRASDFPWQ